MIVLEKFQPEHFMQMKEEPSVAPLVPHITAMHLDSLVGTAYSYAILNKGSGRVLACAGVAEYWAGRGEAWALLSAGMQSDFIVVTKMVKRFLAVCPLRRIEAAVVVDHAAGHRWTQLLGFQLEAPLLRGYTPQGEDVSLYARVRAG